MPNDEEEHDIAVPPPSEPPRPGVLDASPELLAEMNKEWAVVDHGGATRVMLEAWDPVLERSHTEFMRLRDFRDLLGNRQVVTPPPPGSDGRRRARREPLGDWWLNQPGRRQYRGVMFDPGRQHDGWYNTWRGWGVEPKPGAWPLTRELIRDVVAAGDPAVDAYVMRWIAHMVQRPAEPAEVAMVLRGGKGIGKGAFARSLLRIVGRHGLAVSSPEHLSGRFNGHIQDCVLLFADEAFRQGDRASEGRLKALITEPTLALEAKYRDLRTARSHVHIVMASNSDWVVPAGMADERRFMVTDVSEHRRGDAAFWKALHAEMAGDGPAAMLHELLAMDLTGWHPRQDVPQTRALLEQKLRGLPSPYAWWYERLQDGTLPFGTEGDWSDGWVTVAKDALRRDYVEWCKQGGHRPQSEVWFSRATKELFGRLADAEARVGTARTRATRLAPRWELRRAFEAKIGHRVPWTVLHFLD